MHTQNNKGRQQHSDCVAYTDIVVAELTARRSGGSILSLFDRNISEEIARRVKAYSNYRLRVIQF